MLGFLGSEPLSISSPSFFSVRSGNFISPTKAHYVQILIECSDKPSLQMSMEGSQPYPGTGAPQKHGDCGAASAQRELGLGHSTLLYQRCAQHPGSSLAFVWRGICSPQIMKLQPHNSSTWNDKRSNWVTVTQPYWVIWVVARGVIFNDFMSWSHRQ